jgi:RNA polymerase sigma-70 factor (ECF subfamily)
MHEHGWLIEQFEGNRTRLRAVAYRMLGSLSEAEDAVQEAWLRLNRTETDSVDNLPGWLTTVVARVCLDMLRARKLRREEAIDALALEPRMERGEGADPDGEAQLADSVGVALLVVLDTLSPAERLAFVLHDLFSMSFDEIGPIVGRSPEAARQLASRARRRVRGGSASPHVQRERQRALAEAFVSAVRTGDLDALLKVLDPDAVVRIDATASNSGVAREIRGASTWARQCIALARGLGAVLLALIDGSVGLILAPRGKLTRALAFTYDDGKVTQVDVIAEPARLHSLDIALL